MKIGDALFDVSMKTVKCCILCFCICFLCNTYHNKLPRYLPVQIACLSRRLWRLTPEKIIAAPWERSVSARLLPLTLAICWVLLTRWKNKPMSAWDILQENNLWAYLPFLNFILGGRYQVFLCLNMTVFDFRGNALNNSWIDQSVTNTWVLKWGEWHKVAVLVGKISSWSDFLCLVQAIRSSFLSKVKVLIFANMLSLFFSFFLPCHAW